jgi:hypothetical protein
MIAIAAAAFVAGLLHTAAPDHLAAVAGLAARRHARPELVGVAWGCGHAAGVTLLGGAALLVGMAIPILSVSSAAESLVGFALVFIGLRALFDGRRESSGNAHEDAHAPHASGSTLHGAGGTGFIHGLAGSSHLLGALPALILPRPAAAFYLAAFGLGAIAGMSLFAAGLGVVFRSASAPRHTGWLRAGAGFAAVLVGIWWTTSAL